MKMITRNPRSLLTSGLVLAALSIAPLLAQSSGKGSATTAQAGAVASMDARSAFATATENQFRQRGIDARVQLQGDRREVMYIDWQGVRRSDIHNFVTSSIMQDARQMGFTQIVVSNGKQLWEYDLARESMVWSHVQL